MLRIVQCYMCGKNKEWTGKVKPTWYSYDVPNPYVISTTNSNKEAKKILKVSEDFCSKKCLRKYILKGRLDQI